MDGPFLNKLTWNIAHGLPAKRFSGSPGLRRTAQQKLRLVQMAATLNDLRIPPGNRLKQLSGDRNDQYSIRVNDTWRICFRWNGYTTSDIELTNHYT
ncbi:type II toxin-antitoxin system RelE/ParE family toxin [Magnetococcales bacterium HHB-1]